MVTLNSELTSDILETINKLRLSIPHYEPGTYASGDLTIEIRNQI